MDASSDSVDHRRMRRSDPDRRQFQRYPQVIDVQAKELSPIGDDQQPIRLLQGRVTNLSRGGMCILTNEPIALSGVVLCELSFPKLPVPIPALLNVRWSEKYTGIDGENHLAGLQFLF